MKKILIAAAVMLAVGLAAGCSNGSENHSREGEGRTERMDEKGKEDQKVLVNTGAVEAVYPEMAPYPNEDEYFDKKTGEFDSDGFSKVYDVWWNQKRSRRDVPEGLRDSLNPFFVSSIRQFLTEEIPGQEGANRIYSPVNVYMALSMLAETVDGDSRQQILDLLGSDSLEHLRQQVGQVWNASYSQDGAVTSLLANSLWLNGAVDFKKKTLDNLARYYFASSYWGEMGSKEMDEKLGNWLNEQTGGLLEEQASGIHMTDETILALASAIYFRAKWSDEFSESRTSEEIFHGLKEDIACDFMHQGESNAYYWGEKFGAVNKSLQGSGGMWLILPDEGVSPEELLREDQVMDLFLSADQWENQKHLIVNLAMPKFDVVSDVDLIEGLKALGVTDVFDSMKSDFTPLTREEGLFVSQAKHAARVMVDEEGCIATAYTVMAVAGAGMPPEEEMDFVLNRPFIFVITSDAGFPLFAGIVNEP